MEFQGVREVEIFKKANHIKDHYILEYERYHNVKPHLDDKDSITFRWIVINFSLAEAKKVVSEYLKMREEWFDKCDYSVDCLKKNINKVLRVLGKKKPSIDSGLKIQADLSCDGCAKYYNFIGTVAELNDPNILRLCKKCQT